MPAEDTGSGDPRLALRAIGQLDDDEIDLADAAVRLARAATPEADWRAALDHLSVLARGAVDVAASVAGSDLSARAVALSSLLATQHGYRGDSESYENLANADLIQVIERRKGLPVALGVIWLHCAQAAGWPAKGIDFPGHFLIALQGPSGQSVIDVFDGGAVRDARDLRTLIRRVEGPNARLRPGVLQTIGTRGVLLRLQNNIVSRRLRAEQPEAALACLEDMLLIAPADAGLWRQAAQLNQRIDRVGAAIECFERCLALRPAGAGTADLRAAVDELRARLN